MGRQECRPSRLLSSLATAGRFPKHLFIPIDRARTHAAVGHQKVAQARMRAAEIEVERRLQGGGQPEARPGDAREKRRLAAVIEGPVAGGSVAPLIPRDVLFPHEKAVAQAPFFQILETRAASPAHDRAALLLQHFAEDHRAIGLRAGPVPRWVAVAGNAGIIAQGALDVRRALAERAWAGPSRATEKRED